jgi:hypothetical protein
MRIGQVTTTQFHFPSCTCTQFQYAFAQLLMTATPDLSIPYPESIYRYRAVPLPASSSCPSRGYPCVVCCILIRLCGCRYAGSDGHYRLILVLVLLAAIFRAHRTVLLDEPCKLRSKATTGDG